MADDTFQEIAAIVAGFDGPDDAAASEAETMAAGGNGRDGTLAGWLAGWQGRAPARLDRPRIALFAAGHGHDPDATGAVRAAIAAAGGKNHALYRAAEDLDADLRLYEMALDHPSADIRQGAALGRDRAGRAIAYGMMCVEEGVDVLGIDAMNRAVRAPAAALGRALVGALDGPGDLTWPETPDGTLADVPSPSPLGVLARLGGDDIAAMAGAIVAARVAGVPVLLGGPAAMAAAAVVAALRPDGVAHCALVDQADPLIAAFAACLPTARLGGVAAEEQFPGLAVAAAISVLRGSDRTSAAASRA